MRKYLDAHPIIKGGLIVGGVAIGLYILVYVLFTLVFMLIMFHCVFSE